MTRDALNVAFGPSLGTVEERENRGVRYLCVHCDISGVMDADDAKDAEIPVRGFLQSKKTRMSKWEECLPSPWEWHPLRGGLGGNKEFEAAEIEAKNDSSPWITLFVEGKLGKNNSLRMADAQKARAAAPHIPFFPLKFGTFGFGSDGPRRVRAFSRLTHCLFSLTGPRRKRIVALAIDIFLLIDVFRQALPKRTRLGFLSFRVGILSFVAITGAGTAHSILRVEVRDLRHRVASAHFRELLSAHVHDLRRAAHYSSFILGPQCLRIAFRPLSRFSSGPRFSFGLPFQFRSASDPHTHASQRLFFLAGPRRKSLVVLGFDLFLCCICLFGETKAEAASRGELYHTFLARISARRPPFR